MPFRDQIAGGQGALILNSLHSPDYVPGVSGWSINKDGTAEFHGLTIVLGPTNTILVYNGTPAAGNLIVAISPVSGTDAHGNDYTRGVTLGGFAGAIPSDLILEDGLATTSRNGQLTEYVSAATPASITRLFGPQNTNSGGGAVGPGIQAGYLDGTVDGHFVYSGQVNSGGAEILTTFNNVRFITNGILPHVGTGTYVVEISGAGMDINYPGGYLQLDAGGLGLAIGQRTRTPIKINSGVSGLYYYERVAMDNTQVIASAAAFTTLTNLTLQKSYSDYAGAWNLATGIWTCPADGVYEVSFHNAWGAWVSGSRVLATVPLNGTATANQLGKTDESSNTGVTMIDFVRDLTAGDTLRFQVGQVTGVNQSPVTGLRGFISIRRVM